MVRFNVHDFIKYPTDLSYACSTDTIDILSQKHFNLSHGDKVSIAFCSDLDADSLHVPEGEHMTDRCLQEVVFKLHSFKRVKGMTPYLDLP